MALNSTLPFPLRAWLKLLLVHTAVSSEARVMRITIHMVLPLLKDRARDELSFMAS
jgi:hypothetical protein